MTNTETDQGPRVSLTPMTLGEAGATAAAMLPGDLRFQTYRQFYREAQDEFARGFRQYTLTH